MTSDEIKITLVPNGPAKVECKKATIIMTDGSVQVKEDTFHLCRCGHSNTKPFCDGSHKTCGFEG